MDKDEVTTSEWTPGVYLRDLSNAEHPMEPAPTSVTLFIGYAHPFKTDPSVYGEPQAVFSFADYLSTFGGFFSGLPKYRDYLGQAVNQFFLNGGSHAWVIALNPRPAPVPASITRDLVFTAREPVNDGSMDTADGTPMSITITPLDGGRQADIVITYGRSVESYRNVRADCVGDRLAVSSLVSVSGALSSFGSNSIDETFGTPLPRPAPGPAPAAPSLEGPYGGYAGYQGIFDPPTIRGHVRGISRVPVFNLMVLPGITGYQDDENSLDQRRILASALACCEQNRAILIVDAPTRFYQTRGDAETLTNVTTSTVQEAVQMAGLSSPNGAIYFPCLTTCDPVTGADDVAPPSGFVAGAYARTDAMGGISQAPGVGVALNGVRDGVVRDGEMNESEQGELTSRAINCIVTKPTGTLVWGARTLAGADDSPESQPWRYVSVRRLALFIEATLDNNLTWAVFEPNGPALWSALRADVLRFMSDLFDQGVFAGSKPQEAFRVICDETTTSLADQANGGVDLVVGFAPLKPAEFVFVKIAVMTGQR